ncbi:hypothetical protein SAMN05216199_3806 [Pedococcus cremeus]|uniref:Uncharacterized protein n=1 Tax=Pedococcus cremeus TaxID=587636 RepID=A0A1H9XH99_9MICO|nr:hypothetical protein SAMN05216199_3806 [Pedococcus cremeus]
MSGMEWRGGKRRVVAAVLTTVAASVLVVVLVNVTLASHLPHTWWGHELGQVVAAGTIGLASRAVWLRLRTGRWSQGPTASSSD